MRSVGFWVLFLGLTGVACDNPRQALVLAPSAIASQPTPPPTPNVTRHPGLAGATPLAIGETVRRQASASDPLCDPEWPHRCVYFKLTASHNGTLRVTMSWSAAQRDPYPLDIGVLGPEGTWFPTEGPGPQRQVAGPVMAGTTYLVEVWSFLTPPEAFELTASIEPR